MDLLVKAQSSLYSPPITEGGQEDRGLERGSGAYFGFWMESHSGNGCKEQTKRIILSLSHHLDEGHQLSQLFQIAGPVPLGKPGWSVTLYRPFPPTHNSV